MIGNLGPIASSIKRDYCVRFSGNGYCDFGTFSSLNFERTDSFSLYIYTRYTQSTTGIVFARAGNASSARGWSVATNSGKLRFFLRNSNSVNGLQMETNSTFNDGHWHSVIVTYAGTSAPAGVKIYIDNVDQTLTTVTNTLSLTTQGTFITHAGRDIIQDTFQYTGDIAGLAVFNAVISSGDRTTLHNSGYPPNKTNVLALSNLVEFWRMGNTATFPTIPDEKSTNNGTLTNLTASSLQLFSPQY